MEQLAERRPYFRQADRAGRVRALLGRRQLQSRLHYLRQCGSTTDDANTMTADNTYLASQPSGTSPTLLWEYWYEKCWQFKSHGEINEWQSIENQNGGTVGG